MSYDEAGAAISEEIAVAGVVLVLAAVREQQL